MKISGIKSDLNHHVKISKIPNIFTMRKRIFLARNVSKMFPTPPKNIHSVLS